MANHRIHTEGMSIGAIKQHGINAATSELARLDARDMRYGLSRDETTRREALTAYVDTMEAAFKAAKTRGEVERLIGAPLLTRTDIVEMAADDVVALSAYVRQSARFFDETDRDYTEVCRAANKSAMETVNIARRMHAQGSIDAETRDSIMMQAAEKCEARKRGALSAMGHDERIALVRSDVERYLSERDAAAAESAY